MVFLVVLIVIGLIGIVSTAYAVVTDGYRRVDTRHAHDADARFERRI